MNRKTFLEKKIVKKFVVDDNDDTENNDVSQLLDSHKSSRKKSTQYKNE